MLRRIPLRGAAIALLVLATGCTTTHLARPVGRGNVRVHSSLGGPIVRLGAPIPVPLMTVGVAHGLTDEVDVHADLHPTAALFNPGQGTVPTLGADIGFAYHPIAESRAALTLGGALYGFSNRQDAMLFTDLWLSSGFYATRWLFLGAGLHNMLRIGASDPEIEERSPWAPTAFLQVGFLMGRVQLDLEARWYSFTENGLRVTPNFYPIGELGALGGMIGLSYQYDRSAQRASR